jgi:hypothetical protein
MMNLSQHFAVGFVGLASASLDDDFVWLGVRARVRARVWPRRYLDLSAGPYLNDAAGSWEVAFSLDDWIAVSHMRERIDGEWRDHTGVKLGAWPGAVSGIVVPLVLLVVAYSAAASWGN